MFSKQRCSSQLTPHNNLPVASQNPPSSHPADFLTAFHTLLRASMRIRRSNHNYHWLHLWKELQHQPNTSHRLFPAARNTWNIPIAGLATEQYHLLNWLECRMQVLTEDGKTVFNLQNHVPNLPWHCLIFLWARRVWTALSFRKLLKTSELIGETTHASSEGMSPV